MFLMELPEGGRGAFSVMLYHARVASGGDGTSVGGYKRIPSIARSSRDGTGRGSEGGEVRCLEKKCDEMRWFRGGA